MTRGGYRTGAGRPEIDNPAKNRTIRLTDNEYQSYKDLGGADWLKDQIDEALNPTPTEWDNFKKFAFENGVHDGVNTLSELGWLYEKLKHHYGWIKIIKLFKAEGQKRFEREYELGNIDKTCKWCDKYCGGSCDKAKAYILDPIPEIKQYL